MVRLGFHVGVVSRHARALLGCCFGVCLTGMCACQAGGLVGGPVKTQVGKDALAAVVAKKVSADMKMYINASRDAITRTVTSHGISGAVLFWAFAVYWLASKGTNLAQYLIDAQYRKWKSKNARKAATWHDLIS